MYQYLWTIGYFCVSVLFLGALVPSTLFAQEIHNEYQGTWKAKVLEVQAEEERLIPGTDTSHTYQTVNVAILTGPQAGEVVTIENDYLELERGDRFYFNHNVYLDGTEVYSVVSIDRSFALLVLMAVFVGVLVLFGGWQGVRSLLALAGSFLAIFYILLPGIVSGWDPLVASILVAGGVLFAAIFFTHGFTRESVVAYAGTMVAVLLTGVFAVCAVYGADLSGFADEASVYLNFNTSGSINFTSLLLGAIIIGVLGVLDDVAITQAAVVSELYHNNPTLSRRGAYRRALRVGREHVSALVNTLALAYTGASLPLLLHFYISASSVGMALNAELFATEIVRIIVGSVGLVLTVPLVTLLAVWYVRGAHGEGERNEETPIRKVCGHVH
jgi:uncharacterized membrane protein